MFEVEIWGTVSDWVIVIVTFGTAIFLYLTFKEQLRINKALLNQHKRQIRPYFKTEFEFNHAAGLLPKYTLVLTDAHAVDVLIFDTNTFGQLLSDEPMRFHPVWEIGKVEFVPFRKYKERIGEREQLTIWEIKFKDEEGREYHQTLSGNKYGMFTSFPKLVKDPFK